MNPFVLHTPFGQVACRRFGFGPRLLIAFHGFSEDSSAFAELGRQLESSCTLYAVDLPFHGKTCWKPEIYRPAQLAAVVEAILEKEGRPRFEAVGHSLGARLWLHLLPEFDHRMERLYLLAPDGLQTRCLYLLEWMPAGLRRLTARLARRPAWIWRLANPLRRARLIDDFLPRYLYHQLSEAGRRQRLLHTWLSLSHFRLGGKRALRLIRQAKAPVFVLLGKRDGLVNPEAVRKRMERAENVRIIEVEGDHRSICRMAAPYLEKVGSKAKKAGN